MYVLIGCWVFVMIIGVVIKICVFGYDEMIVYIVFVCVLKEFDG